jgi:hypothetical protein
MALIDQLQKDLIVAMKGKEELRLGTIRMVKAALMKVRANRPEIPATTLPHRPIGTGWPAMVTRSLPMAQRSMPPRQFTWFAGFLCSLVALCAQDSVASGKAMAPLTKDKKSEGSTLEPLTSDRPGFSVKPSAWSSRRQAVVKPSAWSSRQPGQAVSLNRRDRNSDESSRRLCYLG